MAFWNRVELLDVPLHIQQKRSRTMDEWIPFPGTKRKLEFSREDRELEEEMAPAAKLFAIDETVKDDVLDSKGFLKSNDDEMSTTSTENPPPPPQTMSTDDEFESMVTDEVETSPQTGSTECVVDNEKNGGGDSHVIEHTISDKLIGGCPSLTLSNEVQDCMAKRPDDISTTLARQMFKQATMAVMLWKPKPSICPLAGLVRNSQEHYSPNNKSKRNHQDFRLNNNKKIDDDDMETSDEA